MKGFAYQIQTKDLAKEFEGTVDEGLWAKVRIHPSKAMDDMRSGNLNRQIGVLAHERRVIVLAGLSIEELRLAFQAAAKTLEPVVRQKVDEALVKNGAMVAEPVQQMIMDLSFAVSEYLVASVLSAIAANNSALDPDSQQDSTTHGEGVLN